jgi:hypothetical protein
LRGSEGKHLDATEGERAFLEASEAEVGRNDHEVREGEFLILAFAFFCGVAKSSERATPLGTALFFLLEYFLHLAPVGHWMVEHA